MPYKLKDTGVTLRYRGLEATEDGRPAEVVELTFEDVGVTPQNKYEVWIDQESRLVTQWAFYRDAADAEPRFTGPWTNWQRHGPILLSDGRGERGHTGVAVFDELPESVFTSSGARGTARALKGGDPRRPDHPAALSSGPPSRRRLSRQISLGRRESRDSVEVDPASTGTEGGPPSFRVGDPEDGEAAVRDGAEVIVHWDQGLGWG